MLVSTQFIISLRGALRGSEEEEEGDEHDKRGPSRMHMMNAHGPSTTYLRTGSSSVSDLHRDVRGRPPRREGPMASQRLKILLISDVADERVGRRVIVSGHTLMRRARTSKSGCTRIMTGITRLTPRALSGCARSRLVKRPERGQVISSANAASTNKTKPSATKFVLQLSMSTHLS